MHKNYLLIVEGQETEQTIFEKILLKYGFNVVKEKEKINIEYASFFDKTVLSSEKENVVIAQGPRNRIHDFLKWYDTNTFDIDKLFIDSSTIFQGIFLIYDVDHNSNEDIKNMFMKFQDESSGLLLLSSPCIEVLGEYNHNRELRYNHLKEYKSDLNIYYEKQHWTNVENYIIKNFEKLCIYYLDKNKNDFNENNIMEHPHLIIDKINELNIRINHSINDKEKSYVIYRYLTTVIYVFIAYINGLTREIDNYSIVREFFLNFKK